MTTPQAIAKLDQVADHFKTILFGADASRTMFYTFVNNPPAGVNATLAVFAAINDKPDDERLIAAVPALWELSDERVRLLGKLYLSLDQSGRNALVVMCTRALGRDSSYARFSAYLFTFLSKYYDLDAAINCVVGGMAVDEIGLNTLRSVSNLLKYDSGLPSDAQLDRLSANFSATQQTLKSLFQDKKKKEIVTQLAQSQYNRMSNLASRIVKQAQEIKYQRLKEHLLNDANLEINQDRQTLTVGLTKFGFGKELVESLEHAEDEYRKADSKFDFKTAVDHNRSFLEALLWETAGKVASIRKEALTARQKFPVEIRTYLHKSGFFSDRFHDLCAAFYGFASEQSTHQLASGREIARVVRNLNIELGLLIIERLESFK